MGQDQHRRTSTTSRGIVIRIVVGVGAFAVAVLASTTVAGVRPASACSCATATVADFRQTAEVGFIGSLVSRDAPSDDLDDGVERSSSEQIAYVFTVDQWLFGGPDEWINAEAPPGLALTEAVIYSSSDGASCGFEARPGVSVAIFADDRGQRFTGGLCSTMPAELALAELNPPVPTSGIARFAALGNLNGNLLAYFDDAGQFLGYGGTTLNTSNGWQPTAASCRDEPYVAVLDGLTIRVVSPETAEDVREPITLSEDLGPELAGCSSADQILVIERPNSGGVRVFDTTTGERRLLFDRPSGSYAITNHGLAVVEYLDPGERLLHIDGDGGETEFGRLDRTADDHSRGYSAIASSPDGALLGVLEVEYLGDGQGRSTIRILDPAIGRELGSRGFEEESWSLQWLDADHLGLLIGHDSVSHIEILDSDTLETVGRVPNWMPYQSVLVDSVLWGLVDGTLYRAELGQEPQSIMTLPTRTSSRLIVLAEPFQRTVEELPPSSTTTATAAVPTTANSAASTEPITDDEELLDNEPNDGSEDELTISQTEGPAGGGQAVRWVGGSVAVAGLAMAGLLMFRQFQGGDQAERP